MKETLIAYGRALRSLREPGIVWHLLWPSLISVVIWTTAAIYSWSAVIAATMEWIVEWPLVGGWISGSAWVTATVLVLVKLMVALTLLPLMYVTAALLVSAIALPLMLERVAQRDYRDLELRRGGSNAGSVLNTVVAGVLFVSGLILSLPLWLLPGAGLVVSVALTAWLNQRAFGYDALMMHADRDELRRLPLTYRKPMFMLGGGCALMAYVPLLNLLAPAYCGLAFVHMMLEYLRQERERQGVVTILDPLPAQR